MLHNNGLINSIKCKIMMRTNYVRALEIVFKAKSNQKPVRFSSVTGNDRRYTDDWRLLKTLEEQGVIEILRVKNNLYFRLSERTILLMTERE
jgi:hypothetical protein